MNPNSPANSADDARLEALLRRATPPLPDDGFSAAVLAALPASAFRPGSVCSGAPRVPASRASAFSRRWIFCVVGAAAGCGFALARGVSLTDFQFGGERLGAALRGLSVSLADPLVGAALIATLFSLVIAFRAELRDKLRP